MTPLIIEVDGRVLRLEGDRTIRIGRAIEADVVLTAGSVSRQHAAIRPVDGVWTLADAGSNYGTFVDGRQITMHQITRRVEVVCGPDAAGAKLVIYPEAVAPQAVSLPSQPPAPAPPPPQPAAGSPYAPPPAFAPEGTPPQGAPALDAPQPWAERPASAQGAENPGDPFGQTQVVSAGPTGGPGGPAMPPSGPDLLLIAEGKEHRFRHPTQVTIGRHPDSVVVLTDPAASRAHGQITPIAGGWSYSNISNEGTYLDGKRISQHKIEDRIQVRLGHPTAGPEITVVPILSAAVEEKRIARRKRKRTLLRAGAVAATLVVIAGLVIGTVIAVDDGDSKADDGKDDKKTTEVDTMKELTGEELDVAESATVLLYFESTLVEDSSAQVGGSGSGSIISKDGLILTNAHVATPEDEDIVEYYGTPPEQVVANPEYLTVFITDPKTGENEAQYRAEVVASDGELDAAVLQIVADDEGGEIDKDDLDLPAIERGDSDDVETGDPVTILGYPGIAASDPYKPGNSVTVTGGKIATVLRDVEEFDTDARVSPGNSGGLAVDNDANLIGIPTKGRGDEQGNVSARIRMINAVSDLIEEAESA